VASNVAGPSDDQNDQRFLRLQFVMFENYQFSGGARFSPSACTDDRFDPYLQSLPYFPFPPERYPQMLYALRRY
jgi:hypothetical protein